MALVLTLRDDELAANPQLSVLVGDLATDPGVTQIAPRPLSLARCVARRRARVDVAERCAGHGRQSVSGRRGLAAQGGVPVSVRDATWRALRGSVPRLASWSTSPPSWASAWRPGCSEELAPGQARAVEEALAYGVLVDDGSHRFSPRAHPASDRGRPVDAASRRTPPACRGGACPAPRSGSRADRAPCDAAGLARWRPAMRSLAATRRARRRAVRGWASA